MADKPGKSLSLPTPMPVRLLRRAAERAQEWPMAGTAVKRLQAAEEWAVNELKHRLDELSDSEPRRPRPSHSTDARAMLAGLLNDADRLTIDQAREREFIGVLGQLCPDQAKMLAVLGDGRQLPLLHVGAGLPAGSIREWVLENATSLGREAGVTLRDDVPRLVGQMRSLGVLHVGPEDAGLKTAYEMLAADTGVRDASVYIKNTLRLWPRIQRHTVSLSRFGQALWAFAGPGS
ncbi:Abi-alpha family protein [Spectribacter hydrogenooxidans]|uniref:Abi-alpha family protein n=1 Tax=Spectribacter hydrogenoxidans TaxID=3075608 RepID=A0ABU3BYW3_9GAMM|nr:Abi-alpha family protein [Salinisphaera sp. W335]MDT0634508.1 Abi-alpha family protein [Salinisphaera sp. W335]